MPRKIKKKQLNRGRSKMSLKTSFTRADRTCTVIIDGVTKTAIVPNGKRGIVGLTLEGDLMFYEYEKDIIPPILKAHCLIVEEEITEVEV